MEEEYRRIYAELQPHREIWSDSILQNWPRSSVHFPREWLDRVRADNKFLSFDDAAPTLERWPLTPSEKQGLNEKKQHEIEHLLPILGQLNVDVAHAVDIGGGQGHLARICVNRFAWQFHTIDRDRKLQDKGQWWLKRSLRLASRGDPRGERPAREFRGDPRGERPWPAERMGELIFVNGELSRDPQTLDKYFSEPETLSIGLHTCGSLALTHFRKSLSSKRIINFGCCYDKTEDADRNLSAIAKELPIAWNQSSLFLATRSRKDLSSEEFSLLKRVNDYRFTFDLLMKEVYPEKGFVIAGDAPKSLYDSSFVEYVDDRLGRLGIGYIPKGKIESFYEERREEVEDIFAAHLIKNLFARPLEKLLLLDRALWLEEQGFKVELKPIFDPQVSPRNLAIIAVR